MEDKNKNIGDDGKLTTSEEINRTLLLILKESIEKFLDNKENENIFINSLSDSIKKIFLCGITIFDKDGQPNVKRVFGILDFLNEKSVEDQRLHFNKWILENIHKSKLSNFLSFILSDTEHIKNCYDSTSFIRSEVYQNALMQCILSLESNQQRNLLKIDELLFSRKNKPGHHRRTVSQPSNSITAVPRKSILSHMKKVSRSFESSYSNDGDAKEKVLNMRRTKSLTNLSHELLINRPRSKTLSVQSSSGKFQKKVSFKNDAAKEVTEQVPFFDYRESSKSLTNCESKQNVSPIHLVKVDDIKIHTDYRYSSSDHRASSSLSSNSSSKASITPKRSSFFSFFESPSVASKMSLYEPELVAASSTSPTAELFLTESVVSGEKIRSKSTIIAPNLSHELTREKRKSSRQNLAHFIHTINSSRHKLELERENLHFHLSEAIIAACEQLKWNKMFNEKFKIPKDCRIKQSLVYTSQKNIQPPPKIRSNPKFTIGSVEDDTESSLSSDEIQDSRKSSTSSDDINENAPRMEWETHEAHSAEGIALSLMSKFKKQQLPSATNLMWLVNESQAPQSMLPLPDSYPINPDESFSFSAIRGNNYFAPPRGQIIFTIHAPPDRKRQMLQQQNRCAGCGIKIAPAYIHKLRYCDYIGKYFCTACHKNQVSVIPSRVLNNWDFNLNPVSNFAYKWLDQIWTLPLFHVSDLNPKLYQKVKVLSQAREARLQLKYVVDFINECRFATKEKEVIQSLPSYCVDDIDIWSMVDFINVKNSIYTQTVQDVIKQCEEHIFKNNCELCNARGFICELCPNKQDVLFPWMNKIKRCIACGSCFHEKCFTSQCSKCERLKRRKRHVRANVMTNS